MQETAVPSTLCLKTISSEHQRGCSLKILAEMAQAVGEKHNLPGQGQRLQGNKFIDERHSISSIFSIKKTSVKGFSSILVLGAPSS